MKHRRARANIGMRLVRWLFDKYVRSLKVLEHLISCTEKPELLTIYNLSRIEKSLEDLTIALTELGPIVNEPEISPFGKW